MAGLAIALVAVGCTKGPGRNAPAQPKAAALPAGCAHAVPDPTSFPVAFVAGGRVWAAAADGTQPTCMFEAGDAGAFAWGPRGDRVALGGLAITGSVQRSALGVEPVALSWGRPAGKAIVFIPPGAAAVRKLPLDGGKVATLTDLEASEGLRGATYRDVVYHPSGRAIAFVAHLGDHDEIWVATNGGANPRQFAVGNPGEQVGPLAFSITGKTLYHGDHRADGKWVLHAHPLAGGGTHLTHVWVGDLPVLRIVPPHQLRAGQPRVALDIGNGCQDQRALYAPLDGGPGRSLLPAATAPTSVAGWLDDHRVLVTEGGCAQPLKLWVADSDGGAPTLIVPDVQRAAVRLPDPTPPPPMPDLGIGAAPA